MSIKLRPATIADSQQVLKWRNDPHIVNLGLTGKTVSLEEHANWFKKTLASEQRLIFIVMHETIPIGQIRFDYLGSEQCEISIYLAKAYTRRGFGSIAIQNACERIFSLWDVNQIIATIKRNNYPSHSSFQKVGFSPKGKSTSFLTADCIQLSLNRSFQIPHNSPTFGEEEVKAVSNVVSSGHWAGGSQLLKLEEALAKRTSAAYAIGVGSGLSALRLALKGLGVGMNDQVIVPAYSCVALANAVLSLGAKPVPVDVDRSGWNINPEKAKQAITEKTRGIIAVNTFGMPAPIEELSMFNLPIVEDCSHGLGIKVEGKILGNRTDVAITSFYATKLIGGGEGGAVITNKLDLAEFVSDWRDYGDKQPHPHRLNDKMNDLEAALSFCQLERLDAMLMTRKELANHYHQYLSPIAEHTGIFRLPDPEQNRIWYRYVIEMLSIPASSVIKELKYKGIHAESPITDWRLADYPACPTADWAFDRLVSLPIYPKLQFYEQEVVCKALTEIIQEFSHV